MGAETTVSASVVRNVKCSTVYKSIKKHLPFVFCYGHIHKELYLLIEEAVAEFLFQTVVSRP